MTARAARIDPAAPPATGARAKARKAMTASLAGEALDLFERDGYDATSIDDICAHAEVSRTTFFRYFGSKEEALMGALLDVDTALARAFEAQPRDIPVWAALRGALAVIVEAYTADSRTTLRVLGVFGSTKSLGAFHQAKVDRWIELLEPELASRMGAQNSLQHDPRPAAALGSVFACLDAALGAWARSGGDRTLAEYLDAATNMITLHE